MKKSYDAEVAVATAMVKRRLAAVLLLQQQLPLLMDQREAVLVMWACMRRCVVFSLLFQATHRYTCMTQWWVHHLGCNACECIQVMPSLHTFSAGVGTFSGHSPNKRCQCGEGGGGSCLIRFLPKLWLLHARTTRRIVFTCIIPPFG